MPSPDTTAAVCATASCVVIGVGNTLMADDGIGVAVIEELRKQALPEHIRSAIEMLLAVATESGAKTEEE